MYFCPHFSSLQSGNMSINPLLDPDPPVETSGSSSQLHSEVDKIHSNTLEKCNAKVTYY